MLRTGLVIAAVTLLLDQLSKWWLLEVMARHPGGLELAPFFRLVMVWNYGVSFGLFNTGDSGQRWILIAVALAMSAALLFWLRQADRAWLAAGLGLVIGGALSNALDRLLHGAVADFLDFHVAGWHWPAFNLADSAIVIGVGMLLIDGLFQPAEQAKSGP